MRFDLLIKEKKNCRSTKNKLMVNHKFLDNLYYHNLMHLIFFTSLSAQSAVGSSNDILQYSTIVKWQFIYYN